MKDKIMLIFIIAALLTPPVILFCAVSISESAYFKIGGHYNLRGPINQKSADGIAKFLRENKGKDVTVNIESNGGRTDYMYKIINRMVSHKGKITCEVDIIAASAAAFMLTACDNLKVLDTSTIVIHIFQECLLYDPKKGCTSSKPISKKHPHYNNSLILINSFKYLLTDKEYSSILGGEDFYFTGKEFNRRLINGGP